MSTDVSTNYCTKLPANNISYYSTYESANFPTYHETNYATFKNPDETTNSSAFLFTKYSTICMSIQTTFVSTLTAT